MPRLILLTGATGYLGGRLLGRLRAAGYTVRCLARRPEYLRPRVAADVEIVAGDVLEEETLAGAFDGVDTAFYLIHSMGAGPSFEQRDRRGAANFAAAARAAGVRRMVYVGGLGGDEELSPHLRSRHEVGRILRESGVPTLEFRASVVIGSGSLSFELVRALSERLPVWICPRWVSVPAQPIAVDDLLDYLTAAVEHPATGSSIVEVGGADVVSYGDLMHEYSRQRGLRRWMIRVPVLTPYLSSLWLGLVTPVYARIGRILIDSIRHPTVVRDPAPAAAFGLTPVGMVEAVAAALGNEDQEFAATRWSDALSMAGPERDWGGVRFGNRLVDSRSTSVAVPPAAAFAPIRRIGGRTGWYAGGPLWRLRGFLDLLVGGVGLRRGRRDPEHLAVGEVVDFWRVEAYEPDRLLRLRAEMKVPGRAWLEFEVRPTADGSEIRQTALFDPLGLGGLAYWYSLWPLHGFVFAGMLRGIARTAQAGTPGPSEASR